MPLGAGFSLEIRPPFRDVAGRFATATAAAASTLKGNLKNEGARLRDLAREEAPSRTGAFSKKISYRTLAGGGKNTIGLELTMPMPLGKFIVGGTKAHLITPSKKQALYWEGAEHPVMVVHHPGTKPNPFVGRAYRRWLPGARNWLDYIGATWSADVRRGL